MIRTRSVSTALKNGILVAGSIRNNRVPEIPLHSGSVTVGIEPDVAWHVTASLSHSGSFYADPADIRAWSLASANGLRPGARRTLSFGVRVAL